MSNGRAKSGAFLLEFVIILLVFSLASAVCVRLFATARELAGRTSELDGAVAAVSSLGETLKASDGSEAALAALLGDSRVIYCDSSWRPCRAVEASYEIRAELEREQGAAGALVSGELAAYGAGGGALVYSLEFARFYPQKEAAA